MTNIDPKQQDNLSKKEVMEKFAEKQSIEFTAKDLKAVADKLTNNQDNYLINIKDATEELNKQAYTLNKLPEKVGDYLINLVPQISEELHKRVLEDFDRQLELRNIKLNATFQRLESAHQSFDQKMRASYTTQLENLAELNTSFQQVQNAQLRKKILTYIISTVFLFGVALSACWTAFKYFPSKVHIHEGNNITAQSSDVTVWGKDFKVIEKIREKEGSKTSKR